MHVAEAAPAGLRIRLPYPHAGQQRVLAEQRRFNWLCAGRRWRKTTLGLQVAIPCAAAGGTVLWGAPKADQTMTAWDEFRRAIGDQTDPKISRMDFPIGPGRVLFRTLDNPHAARSKTADMVILDEAADLKPWAWHEVIRPMLGDTLGSAWIMGTPRGLNWFWEEWTRAQAGIIADSAAWQIPVRGAAIVDGRLVRRPNPYENPEYRWSELEATFASTPLATFQQEYLADFVDSGDAVFASADVDALRVGWLGYQPPHKGARYLHAWDIGRRRDATVGVTVDWSREPYQVVAFERVVGVPYPRIQAMIAERQRLYGGKTWVEFNGVGDPVIENLDVRAEGFVTSARSKVQAITALQMLLEARALKLGDPQAIAELRGYHWDDAELVQDCVMALAIAAAGLPAINRKPRRPNDSVTPAVDRANRPSLTLADMQW